MPRGIESGGAPRVPAAVPPKRREAAFRRATGLPLQTGYSVHPVPKRAGGNVATVSSLAMAASPHLASTAVAAASATSRSDSGHMVPLFPSASDARGRQGFARVINHSDEAGEATIEAFGDEGTSYGPLTLSIDAGETIHFNSADLENGNAGKGLTGSTGPGQGDWRLQLDSDLDIEVLSYIRTGDGFLTAMHDTAPVAEGRHEVAVFNPGSNANQESLLRLVNPGDVEATATITAVDDKGASPGDGATATVPAGASRTYTAAQLEAGGAAGLEGSIGDGAGKWRLVVESGQDIVAMSLMSLTSTGHLTNLSTAPDNEEDGTHSVPLFPSASDANRQGFVRVVNRSAEAGEVTIAAHDDTDVEYDTLTLAIGANEAVHFNSDDLELGNADKGLTGSTGAGEGDWRLEFESGLDIQVLAYIRTGDGFLTAMHDVVPRSAKRHRVAVFNPGSNAEQQSLLRLVNAGDGDAEVTIAGFDGNGDSPGSDVVVAVPAGSSTTLTAQNLEAGSLDFEGALGDGAGKWSLTATADREIAAMSLLSSPTGHLTNLSTAPQRGAGPVETAEEAFEALISPIVQSKCVTCHFEGNTTGNMPVFVRDTDADHLAKNLQEFEDYLEDVEDGANRILNKIQGALGHGGGSPVPADTPEFASFEQFLTLLGAEIEEFVAVDLFEGVEMEPAWRTLRRAAIVFAGRIPTEDEYTSIEDGSEDDLRVAIRDLMQGPRFHEFSIRAANDRLLTDREMERDVLAVTGFYVDFDNEFARQCEEAYAAGTESEEWTAWHVWQENIQHGAGREPLELIAHVVENDLPYTQVMTADYLMANPFTARAYGSTIPFDDSENPREFRPVEIVSYFRTDESKKFGEAVPGCAVPVVDPGLLSTRYPHAGVLNAKAFLQRYPTTPTNRNRARARWTYYHFLDLDVEKSASRTTDPVALADTDNPTMHNPACKACHVRMDPVAGAFQNYGATGLYKEGWRGVDSLDEAYKYDPPGGQDVTVASHTWEDRSTVSVDARLRSGSNTLGFKVIYGRESYSDDSDWTPHIGIDRVALVNDDGDVVGRYEVEDLEDWEHLECGHPESAKGDGQFDSYRLWDCIVSVPVTVEAAGDYRVDVTAFVFDDGEERHSLTLRVWAPGFLYRIGDTWYRGMRQPGFVAEPGSVAARVPEDYNANSLQWLAQRIVEDERFAEAAVKFWWPAVMGNEILPLPEEPDDADYEARKLEAEAQGREVRRIADGFRRGFDWSGKGSHNLKDLLVEVVMSPWFRAARADGIDQTVRDALRHAGARRLLTPEELARKTLAVTGFQWGRTAKPFGPVYKRDWVALTDSGEYRLLYGGIDSDGITERAREMTPTMAGVVQSHALETSCPVVMRELYLTPDRDRRLFGGIDKSVSPVFEFGETFEIAAESRSEMETLSLSGHLTTGTVNVSLAYLNDYNDEQGDRDILLDRLTVRRGNEVILRFEMEDLDHPVDCHHVEQDAFHLSGTGPGCVLSVPVVVPCMRLSTASL